MGVLLKGESDYGQDEQESENDTDSLKKEGERKVMLEEKVTRR